MVKNVLVLMSVFPRKGREGNILVKVIYYEPQPSETNMNEFLHLSLIMALVMNISFFF